MVLVKSKTVSKKKIYFKKSNIHGSGIFAKKNIKRGDFVFIIKGEDVNFVVKNSSDIFYGENWVGTGKNQWRNPSIPSVYLNHSCNPNCGIKSSVTVVAIKNISEDDEITIDYSTIEETDGWYMTCKCGQSNCRRKITSIKLLPKDVYLKYLPYIPKYFQKVYNSENKTIT